MKYNRILSASLFLSSILFGSATLDAAPIAYQVSVDTSTISGFNGFVEFQFANGSPGSEAATATITNLSGGTLNNSPDNDTEGDVSGSLPGPLAIGNTTSYNDVYHSFTFGSALSFNVSFSGPALDSPNPAAPGSTFSLTLWDDQTNQVLVGDPNSGAALLLNVNSNGSTNIAATNPAVQAQVVPEPSSMAIFAFGLLVMWSSWRLRWRRQRVVA